MSRRRTSLENDSLDLLLDTITNTFGGILLVALLLVLLIRNTSEQQADSADEAGVTLGERERLISEVAQLRERRETLRESAQMQQQLEADFSDPQKQQLAKELGELLNDVNSLQETESSLRSNSLKLGAEVLKLEQDKASGRQEAVGLQAELASAELALKNELALRTRTMELPREEFTNKAMTCLFLVEGKLYFPDKGAGRAAFQLNSDQFEECSESEANLVLESGTSYRIRRERGIGVARNAVQSGLKNFNNDGYYLTVVCDRDSFDEFGSLKDILVDLGYEHRILPLAEPKVFESTSRERPRVQ